MASLSDMNIVPLLRSRTLRVPTPLAGLALGIAALGLGLDTFFPWPYLTQTLGALVAAILFVCVALKLVLNPSVFLSEMEHSVMSGIMPVLAMTLMLVSAAIGVWLPGVGVLLWIMAVALHLFLLVLFLWQRVRDFSIAKMTPSWLIPFVGLILATVTSPSSMFNTLSLGFLVFGTAFSALLMPAMIYRLVFYELADEAKPTIAIMVAPASLILMGYLSVFPEASVFICGILAGIAFLMTMFVYLALFRLLRLPFSPAFAALAFPLVTGGTALNRLARFMAERQGAELIGLLGKGTMIVAVGITVYVSVLYIREYWYRMAS